MCSWVLAYARGFWSCCPTKNLNGQEVLTSASTFTYALVVYYSEYSTTLYSTSIRQLPCVPALADHWPASCVWRMSGWLVEIDYCTVRLYLLFLYTTLQTEYKYYEVRRPKTTRAGTTWSWSLALVLVLLCELWIWAIWASTARVELYSEYSLTNIVVVKVDSTRAVAGLVANITQNCRILQPENKQTGIS